MLYAGAGSQTIEGRAGRDTVFGGVGPSSTGWLDGGSGRDVLVSGRGDETLHGGAGGDMFEFGSGSGRDVVDDFDLVRDKLRVAPDINGSIVAQADDLRAKIGSGLHGDVVLDLGGGATVMLLHVPAGMLEARVGTSLQVAPI